MKQLQFSLQHFVFRPSLVGTLTMLICIPLFIKLGLWQYHKAQQKLAVQAVYMSSQHDGVLDFPLDVSNQDALVIDAWKYKKVKVSGYYAPQYQVLLDNQTEGNRAGYHVITPLQILNTQQYVLVNRGWIVAKDTHTELPRFETPTTLQTIEGQIWVPSKKFFTLENVAVQKAPLANTAWQNMDMVKYQKAFPIDVSAMAIKLDPAVTEGGFVRNWQIPVERIATNIGYAYQWFGFAIATLFIYMYMSFTRVKINHDEHT